MASITWTENLTSIASERRLDPEYFDPRQTIVEDALQTLSPTRLAEWAVSSARGASPAYDPDGDVRVIKTAHIRRFGLSKAPEQFVVSESDPSATPGLVPAKSLLITSTGVGSLGRTFFYHTGEPIVADGHITIVPVRGTLEDGAFLCAYLQSPPGRQQLIRLHRGSSRQIELYPVDVRDVLIPGLSEDERNRIGKLWLAAENRVRLSNDSVNKAVSAIEAHVGVTNSTSLSTQIWVSKLNEFTMSRRIDAEHLAPNIQDLKKSIDVSGSKSLSALCRSISKGVQPEGYDDEGDVFVIKTKDVNYPEFDLGGCDRAADGGWASNFLKPGNVLLNATGEGTLGRAAVVPAEEDGDPRIVAAVDICVLDVDPAQAKPEYVALFLNSWMGRQQTNALQTGSSGQQHIYPAHLAHIRVPIRTFPDGSPDLDWQQSVVDTAAERALAMDEARKVGEQLDDEFMNMLQVEVDLGTVPY